MRWILILFLVWHIESFLNMPSVVERVNELSETKKNIKQMSVSCLHSYQEGDVYLLTWAEEKK